MDHRDTIAKEVALELGQTRKQVEGVLKSHFGIAAHSMRKGIDRTIYIPKVGYFMPGEIRRYLKEQAWTNFHSKKENQVEQPLIFN